MSKELKPCPFCGSEAGIRESPTVRLVYVCCKRCFCESDRIKFEVIGDEEAQYQRYREAKATAILLWNKRV